MCGDEFRSSLISDADSIFQEGKIVLRKAAQRFGEAFARDLEVDVMCGNNWYLTTVFLFAESCA